MSGGQLGAAILHHPLAAGLSAWTVVVSAVTLIGTDVAPQARVIEVDALEPLISIEELHDRAEIIVLVVADDHGHDHWNNRRNKEWTAPEAIEEAPMIVRDTTVEVISQSKGPAAGTFEVRMAGGRVGSTYYVYRGATELLPGIPYILFLQRVEWPTEEGFENVLTPILQGQGVFTLVDGEFRNSAGTRLNPADAGL